MRVLGIDPGLLRTGYGVVDVMGVSWGGGLAQQFAFQHPKRVGRLVLAATSGAINVRLMPLPEGSPPPEEGDPAARPDPQLAHLGSVVGLVWRSVVLWMLLLALLTLARI